MTNHNSWIVFDGEVISADTPVVPVTSRGLMYGDGIFETLRTYSGQTLFLQDHLDRLQRGAEILGISVHLQLKTDQIKPLLYELLKRRRLLEEDAILRLQLWRDGQRGYQTDFQTESHFSITASHCPKEFSFPQLITVNRRRIPSQSLPSKVKLTNGINYILAAQEASEKGGDDALMQTVDGWISETTIANIFWIKDHTFFTPDENCDLIPGITRNIILQMIDEDSSWELEQGKYDLNQLWKADAAFMCNSVREILPVKQVDEKIFDTRNEFLKGLQNRFLSFRDKNLNPLGSR